MDEKRLRRLQDEIERLYFRLGFCNLQTKKKVLSEIAELQKLYDELAGQDIIQQ